MKKSVLIIDGLSTGQFYPQEIKKRGYRALHLVSDTGNHLEQTMDHFAEAVQELRTDYDKSIPYLANIQNLVTTLSLENIAAVIPGAESGVEFADRLSELLGVPTNGTALSAARRDKYIMQETIRKAGLRSIRSIQSNDLAVVLAWTKTIGTTTFVVKPLRSCGTENITFCQTEAELIAAFSSLVGEKNFFGELNNQVLVQERIFGTEYAVNMVSREGRHILSDIWEYRKIVNTGGMPIYDSTTLVVHLEEKHQQLLEYAKSVLDALNIRFGASHIEIMLTDNGPVLIECAARPMGGAFPQNLIEECLGHTQIQWSLDSYLDPVQFTAHADKPYCPAKHFLIKSIISHRQAQLSSIPAITLATGLRSARMGNFIHTIENWQVSRTVDLFTSPAFLFLCHEDESILMEDYATLRSLEEEAQNQLFEALPTEPISEWVEEIPDKYWLAPEEKSLASATLIHNLLQLTPDTTLLDCPCGDCRVGIHLIRQGVRYTGIDSNPRFIAAAKERLSEAGLNAAVAVGDMRELAYNSCFDVILNWYNSFGYFDVETDFAILKSFTKALRPGGKLLLEAPNRTNLPKNAVTKHDLADDLLTPQWDENAEVLLLPITVEGSAGKKEILVGARMYTLSQYKLLLRLAGLELCQVCDENANEVSDKSNRMIFLARRPINSLIN